jgi:hypothetical protein
VLNIAIFASLVTKRCGSPPASTAKHASAITVLLGQAIGFINDEDARSNAGRRTGFDAEAVPGRA